MAAGVLAATVARESAAQPADEHGAAAALVAQLEHDAAHAAVTYEAIAHAKDALERATRLRTAGDEAHAKAADGVALEWAQVARDLAKAADAEATAADLRRKAVDAQAQLERARAQVEEGIAHVGRLRAELAEAEKAPKIERTAVEAHEGDKDKDDKGGKGHKKEGPAGHKGGPAKAPATKPAPKLTGGAP
jgi:hypothetical protein